MKLSTIKSILILKDIKKKIKKKAHFLKILKVNQCLLIR